MQTTTTPVKMTRSKPIKSALSVQKDQRQWLHKQESKALKISRMTARNNKKESALQAWSV